MPGVPQTFHLYSYRSLQVRNFLFRLTTLITYLGYSLTLFSPNKNVKHLIDNWIIRLFPNFLPNYDLYDWFFLNLILGPFSLEMNREGKDQLRRHVIEDWSTTLKVGVPALLYLIQNQLMFTALANLDPATYQVLENLIWLSVILWCIYFNLELKLAWKICILIWARNRIKINLNDQA